MQFYDKLTPDLQEIVAIRIAAPRQAWAAEILRSPAAHFRIAEAGVPPAEGLSDLKDTPINRDMLDHVFLKHVDSEDPVPEADERLGDPVPVIDGEAGEVRWTKAVIEMSGPEIAAKEAAVAAAETQRLDDLLISIHDGLDKQAEQARCQFITAIAGQEGTYLLKAEESTAIMQQIAAEETPDPADYPMIAEEASECGDTLAERAALVAATRAAWIPIAASIEAKRIAAKETAAAARATDDEEGIRAAAVGIEWPEP